MTLVIPHRGQVLLCPDDASLIADALAHYSENLDGPAQESRLLHCEALSCAFMALAMAMVFEWYLTPVDEGEAMKQLHMREEAR